MHQNNYSEREYICHYILHVCTAVLFVPSRLVGQIMKTKEAASRYYFSSLMEMIRSRI